jgi:ribonuclease HI/uncharacterized phage-like protein YoqJ
MTTVVFTDGACSGNPGPGGWAWAVPGGPFAAGPAAHTTNQRMEITAVLEALRALDGRVEVVSDSTYVINCFRDRWWEGWLKRNWTTSAKKPVANRDLWEPLIELVRSRSAEIEFRWVKGHSGDPMNDLVDALAVEAGKTQQPSSGERSPVSVTKAKATDEAPPGHLLMITGHKPPELGGYAQNEIADRTRLKLTEIIVAKAQLNPDLVVMTGMGLGAEQLAAEAAVAADVPFVAVLPYPDQQSVWPKASQDRYDGLLGQAKGQVLLQLQKPENKQKAGAALNRQAAWFARNSQEAVVVWNGTEQYVGKVVRSLQDALGETEVWLIDPSHV